MKRLLAVCKVCDVKQVCVRALVSLIATSRCVKIRATFYARQVFKGRARERGQYSKVSFIPVLCA